MGKRRRMLVAALVLAVVGGLASAMLFRPEPEPVYQGKRLSEWLEVFRPVGDAHSNRRERAETTEVVRHLGTNTIPTLLRMLRANDSPLKAKLFALLEKQRFVKIHHIPADELNRSAPPAFYVLGASAKDAVPELLKIYEANISPHSRWCTMCALNAIGPGAKAAMPLLIRVATNTNMTTAIAQTTRLVAIESLGRVHTDPNTVVPILIKLLSDQDSGVRIWTANALRDLGGDAEAVVPRLFELLKDRDSGVRRTAADAINKIDPDATEKLLPFLISSLSEPEWNAQFYAVNALARIGPDAKPAVLELFKLLQSKDSTLRQRAVQTIKNIDPETAALRKAELDAAIHPEPDPVMSDLIKRLQADRKAELNGATAPEKH